MLTLGLWPRPWLALQLHWIQVAPWAGSASHRSLDLEKVRSSDHDEDSPTRLLLLLGTARLLVHPELTPKIVSTYVSLPVQVF